jgi:maleamate amidohydrolase
MNPQLLLTATSGVELPKLLNSMSAGINKTFRDYRKKGIGNRVGFGLRPAVIVVDFIVGFTDLKSPLAANLDQEIRSTLRVLSLARQKRAPIVFSTVAYQEDGADAGVFIRKVPSLKTLHAGTRWVEIDERLGRREDEMLLVKKFASCFFGTHLASYLTSLQVDTLIVTGCTTSGCVRATVVDGMQNGFRVIVPSECVGDRAQGPHEANLLDIDAKYGDVASLNSVLSFLGKL